jgi:hypothetical protein
MIRYFTMAALLKACSLARPTRRLYRLLAKSIGARCRAARGLPESRVRRGLWLLDVLAQHDIVHPGQRLLELGTGWIHWESVFVRLFYDVHIVLFDVVDNRQLCPLKRYLADLPRVLGDVAWLDARQRGRVQGIVDAALAVASFDELYDLLGFRYVVHPDGDLSVLQEESFHLVFSYNVLEHVRRNVLDQYVRGFRRVLMPGGYSVHSIDMGDHLAYYCPDVCAKNYLKYSERSWRLCFQNEVQYFNRVQRPEWLRLLSEAGLDLLHEECDRVDVSGISIDDAYATLPMRDLECVHLSAVHRRPS